MIVGQYLFIAFMGLMFSVFLVFIPSILLMHFLMPQVLLDKYFKPPYFGQFERAMFTGIPYAPMRTIMLMGVIVFPRLGKKRKLTEVYKDTPRWYRIAVKVCLYSYFIIFGGSIITLTLSLLIGWFVEGA